MLGTHTDKVMDDLNEKNYDQCKNLYSQLEEDIFISEYGTLDVAKLVSHVNPILWKAFCMLTRSVSERRGTSTSQKGVSTEKHKRNVRRLFRVQYIFVPMTSVHRQCTH